MMQILYGLFLALALVSPACADTLYLSNGRSIEGIVVSEDKEAVRLDVGAGSVRFLKSEIKSIARSSLGDTQDLRKKWGIEKQKLQERIEDRRIKEERKPRETDFAQGAQGIILDVLLDDRVEARMVLDTGASVMLVSKRIAQELDIDLNNVNPDMQVIVADGRKVNAKLIILNKVKVQESEATGIEAAVLLDEFTNSSFSDGLLGMSFLRKFNFKVDQKEKKLILEKL